jgi:hypothetical protein
MSTSPHSAILWRAGGITMAELASQRANSRCGLAA